MKGHLKHIGLRVFAALLCVVWTVSAALASHSAVSDMQGQHSLLCGNGAGGVVTFADLGLRAPELDKTPGLPDPNQCDCDLSYSFDKAANAPRAYSFESQSIIALPYTPQNCVIILQTIRAGYTSRAPPL